MRRSPISNELNRAFSHMLVCFNNYLPIILDFILLRRLVMQYVHSNTMLSKRKYCILLYFNNV